MAIARILVVEDEGVTALSIKTALTKAGYEVPGLAASGEDAVRLSAEVAPDLVIMDIRLEGKMDGIEAADRIRESLHIPVVYLTAYRDKSTLSRARETEPFGYVLKPFDEQSLLVAVEMSLYKGRMDNRLRNAKEKLEAILRCVSDGVVLVDMKGMVDYLNPAAASLLEMPEKQQVPLSIFRALKLLDGPSGERIQLPFEDVVLQGEVVNLRDRTLVTTDGRTISVDIDLAPYWDESGTGRGMILAIRDVSQRHDLQDLPAGGM